MQTLRLAIETLRHDPMKLVWPLVIFAVTYLLGMVARGIVLRTLQVWVNRVKSRPGQILIGALRGPMVIWAIIAAAHTAIQGSELPERYTTLSAKTLLVLWIISLTLMSMRLAGELVRDYGDQVPGALPVTTLTQTLAQLGVVVLGIVLILTSLNFQITPILTALGVGGLAVALALQDTLSNLFSGFYVAVARQIRLNDYIKLSSGEEGYVTDIGWRSTTIRSLNSNVILIPNVKLAQAIVTNYCLPDKRLSASVQVSVDYASDPDHVERILLDLARKAATEVPGLLADPAPSISFDPGFGESALQFTVNYQVSEFVMQFGVRAELRKRIIRRFREEGITIPYPTRVVYMEQRAGGGQ